MIEEFFYAALDIKSFDWALFFLKIVGKHFPQSVKSMRMLAMLHEASQDADKARNIYKELILTNPNDF